MVDPWSTAGSSYASGYAWPACDLGSSSLLDLGSWLRFCTNTLDKTSDQFVIEQEEITLWSCNFANVGPFKNYLAGLLWSCELHGVPTTVFADPLIRLLLVSSSLFLRLYVKENEDLHRTPNGQA